MTFDDLLRMCAGRRGVFHVGRTEARDVVVLLRDAAGRYAYLPDHVPDHREWDDVPDGERIGTILGYPAVLKDRSGVWFVEAAGERGE